MESFEPRLLLTTSKLKITNSDKLSLGYETMTMLSDSDSEVSHKSHTPISYINSRTFRSFHKYDRSDISANVVHMDRY